MRAARCCWLREKVSFPSGALDIDAAPKTSHEEHPVNVCGITSPFTWRGLFYFLSPLGGLSAAFAVYMLPSTAPIDSFRRNLAKIDWLGSLTSTVAIVAFLIPLLRDDTWDSKPIIISLSVSGASLVAFLLVEWKVASLPILPRKSIPSAFRSSM